MPVNAQDAVSFKALIPYTVSTIVIDDAKSVSFRMRKSGYASIVSLIAESEAAGSALVAFVDVFVSGARSDTGAGAKLLAALNDAAKANKYSVGELVRRGISEAPDLVIALLVDGVRKDLKLQPGETVDDFIDFLRSLSPSQHADLMLDWMHLNLPGGVGPFVTDLERAGLSLGLLEERRVESGKDSGEVSTEQGSS